MLGKRRDLVGVDIGSSSVKAVQLKRTRHGLHALAVAAEPLPPGAVASGAILDPAAVAAAIRRACAPRAFSREASVAIAGAAAIVKRLAVPLAAVQDLDEAIRWEAAQHIPFAVQEVNLDYQILDVRPGVDADGRLDVLIAAAKKEIVADYASVVAQAGLSPAVIDLAVFAFQNAYEANYEIEPHEIVVLLNAGASAVTVNVLHGRHPFFTRDIPVGGNTYREALQRELGLPADVAEHAARGAPIPDVSAEEVQPVLRATTEQILSEVHRTFDFIQTAGLPGGIDRIVLGGGASRIPALAGMVRERFDAPVTDFDPFRRIARGRPSRAADEGTCAAAVAVGLALRRAGDRQVAAR